MGKEETNLINKILPNGTLHITEEVLAVISSICVQEVKGLETVSPNFKNGLLNKFNKTYSKKGISISEENNKITIQLNLSVTYGGNIVDKCLQLQKVISEEIGSLTGVIVDKIDINVESITYENDYA